MGKDLAALVSPSLSERYFDFKLFLGFKAS